jgi:hypothetical protein
MTEKNPVDRLAQHADIIVAVHDLRRNIDRAVRSILADPDPRVRALVIAHNLPRDEVAHALADLVNANPSRVRIAELADGVPSPSGPFNHGLAISDAEYVGIMGSDDELDPGAVSQWRRTADRYGADAVIAKVVRGEQRTLVRSPPKRVLRTGVLNFSKDRLSYRSAPLGLIRAEAVTRLGLRLMDGARNGGDLPFVTRLWLRGRVVPAQGLAAYVEHADAPVRVTHVAKPVVEELWPVSALLDSADVAEMSGAQRDALVTKILRRNLLDAVRKRGNGRDFTGEDLTALRDIIARLDSLAPGARGMISSSQAALFEELMTENPDLERVADLDRESTDYRSLAALRPAQLRYLLHAQGQPRFTLASASIKIGASRYFPLARAGLFVALIVLMAALAALIVHALL